MSLTRIRIGAMEYLTAEGIPVPHGFTTRLGGVSEGHLAAMNIGIHRGDNPENVRKNYEILGETLGFDPEKLVLTTQTHSDIIILADETLWGTGLTKPELPPCDGLITNTPGTTLVVFTADCTPVLLWDSASGAVGAAHAGWKGTAQDIAGKTARAMIAAFGCDPRNIHAAIGPNIGQCHFETDADVPEAMVRMYGTDAEKFIEKRGEKFFPDLKQINALSLRRAGVEHIDISGDCTMCRPDLYWSARITGSVRGAQGALITCQGDTQ